MLLTKPLTTLLHHSLTPSLHTLLLLTPSGRLLSSASPHSASILRNQATLAISLWEIYAPLTADGTLDSALKGQDDEDSESPDDDEDSDDSNEQRRERELRRQRREDQYQQNIQSHDLKSITIQLTNGILLIRALKCGLIFAGISSPHVSHPQPPSFSPTSSTYPFSSTSPTHALPSGLQALRIRDQERLRGEDRHLMPSRPMSSDGGVTSSAASTAGSVRGGGGELKVLRRRMEDLSRWLDDELMGWGGGGPL
jgi:hypothetical protein